MKEKKKKSFKSKCLTPSGKERERSFEQQRGISIWTKNPAGTYRGLIGTAMPKVEKEITGWTDRYRVF